ncbi:MAG: hypothetical protein LBS09_05125 [Bacteroidales bacterium]|jgi:hypothetical protein|nr:hypothetical protein [Bacteroidales bacterium]
MRICKKYLIIALIALTPCSLTFHGCEEAYEIIDYLAQILSQTGWLADDENMDNIPEDITPFPEDGEQLAGKVSLESKFPPIGDQGSYGTCVAWATGYNLKTALNAIENGWNTSQLADRNNQTSPQDLWLAIPASKRGGSCNGTNFEPALDAMIACHVGSLSAVPYAASLSCTGSSTGKGQNNKLANYRKIASETDGLTPDNFKGYLNAGRPVAFGARLGDRFMSWKGSGVISSDTYNNPGMQHAYHAMVLTGYDDTKGAFRVRNSWGTSWGDGGSIWVDYAFFCNNFCFAAFVAQNVNNVSVGNDGNIGSGNLSRGDDLLAYHAEDRATTPADNEPDFNRAFSYEVYNSGNATITPAQDWTVTYMLYNAKNAKQYDIIFEDYYTTKYGTGDGHVPNTAFLSGGGWYNNYSVASGKRAGEAEYGAELFEIYYKMSATVSGEYYLVVMADSYNKITEANEDNNFYFISAEDGKPLKFVNGVPTNMPATKSRAAVKRPAPEPFSNTETQTLVKPGNLNTYTPAELKAMLLHDKETGKLDVKIKAYRALNGNVGVVKKTISHH